ERQDADVSATGTRSGISPSERGVVISLHGIRTYASWQKDLAEALSHALFIPVSLDYGRFGIFPFLFHRNRENKIKWFVDRYHEIRIKYPGVIPSIIAHSFGTYIVARAIM